MAPKTPWPGLEAMDNEAAKGYKIFQDSVHGVMRFHPLIVKFIDTVMFQRLRNIKQLSMTYLVFPAAAHNRFEHSLGVAFLAGELMRELQANSPNVWKEIFSKDEEGEGERTTLAVQIAGLLHDIGHGPFSHTWEVFVKACGDNWDHENTSCELIDLMLWERKDGKLQNKQDEHLTELGKKFKKEFKDVDKYVGFIKDIIRGMKPNKIKEPKKAFVYQVVANKFNDIDVDKYDYFLRDAQHLKMNVNFDYIRLIKLSCIKFVEGTSYVAFRDVEEFSIQAMFRVRAELHIRAYQHRVVKNLELMLIDALKEANENGYCVGNLENKLLLSQAHKDPETFSTLTDSIQELLLYSTDDKLKETRKLLTRIATRDLYTTVAEWPLRVVQSEEEEKRNEISKGLTREMLNELETILGKNFAVTQMKFDQGKYFDPLANVHFFPKYGQEAKKGNVPEVRMELPFYKLLVFMKEKEEHHDPEEIKKKVEEFLETKGISLLVKGVKRKKSVLGS